MKLWIGCDHAALEAKEEIKNWLKAEGHEVGDVGTHTSESCHYPEYATLVAREIQKDPTALGILLCGSGIGVSMVANRYKHIRAALVRSSAEAELARAHNNANILCLGARITPAQRMKEIIEAWFAASYEGGRHDLRLKLFDAIGADL